MNPRHPSEYPLTLKPTKQVDPVREALVIAIARIAQKACRNGEAGSREWPALAELPMRESWRCIGEDYADSVMATMLSATLSGSAGPR